MYSRSNGRVRLQPRDTLHIAPVEHEDIGVYQCMASFQHQYSHGIAHVTLGGE